MRTLIFALRTTKHSRAVLTRTLHFYTHAARAVLGAAERDWDAVRAEALYNDRLSDLSLARTLNARYRARTMIVPLHGSLRDALFSDLAAALKSYDALSRAWDAQYARLLARATEAGWSIDPPSEELAELLDTLGDRPGWPTVPRVVADQAAYLEALDRLTQTVPDMEQPRPTERPPRIRLSDPITTGTRPLWFPRADGAGHTRNFALARSAKDSRYYALLYLLPGKDPHSRPLAVPPPSGKRGVLVAVHKEATVLERKSRPSAAILAPLSCGAWHERALRYADEHPEAVRTARLFHRPACRTIGGTRAEWFGLAITFALPDAEAIEPRTVLGVSMRQDATVGWSIMDEAGTQLASGTLDHLCNLQARWRTERRYAAKQGRIPPRVHHLQAEQVKHATHIVANALVEVAATWAARVVLDDVRYLRQLVVRPPKEEASAAGEPVKRAARTAAWHAAQAETHYRRATLVIGSLESILAYKLPSAGLPPPLMAGGISPRDCPSCGGRGRNLDVCSLCGTLIGPTGTALVTARRLPEIRARQQAARARRQAEADDAAQEEEE